MKRFKKRMAVFLSVFLLASMIPTTSLADEYETLSPIIYNLGNQEITVGYDEDQAEETPWNYKLFDEEGGYCIPLEDNAFFPYEVQFKVDGEVTSTWFETPDSTVQIEGHMFSVFSEGNDHTKLSQIGVWIENEYIAARPEPKEFTNPMIQPMSLLPLTEVHVSLDLSGFNRYQLKNVQVETILSGLTPDQTIEDGAKVVWTSLGDDRYERIERTDTFDFSNKASSFNLKMIVGSTLQLDDSNTRYIVNVSIDIPWVVDAVSLYKKVGDTRSEITPLNTSKFWYSEWEEIIRSYISRTDLQADAFYVGVSLGSVYDEILKGQGGTSGGMPGGEPGGGSGDETKSYYESVTVYNGSFETIEDAENAASLDSSLDITEKLIFEDMEEPEAGLLVTRKDRYVIPVTFVFENSEGKDLFNVEISFYGYSGAVNIGYSLYAVDSDSDDIVSDYDYDWDEDVEIYTYTLYDEYSADDTHYLRLQYTYDESTDESNRIYVDKAVVGFFDSLEEALGQTDIKDQLFPEDISQPGSGYAANYSGDGQNFTVFAEGRVHKFTIKAEDIQHYNYVSIGYSLYGVDSTTEYIVSDYNWGWNWEDNVEINTYTLKQDYSADDTHYLRLLYSYKGSTDESNRSYVDKAVVGFFDSLEAVSGQTDIKDQLFPEDIKQPGSGYAANYSGDGQNFTVFAEGEVYKFTIKAKNAPAELYFDIHGAVELTEVYEVPYEHDSYGGMGFFTFLYLDDVDPSLLTPLFDKGYGLDIYAGQSGSAGTLQESGVTQCDFSDGSVQYVAGSNGVDMQNFWVTFIKKHTGGSKLFVNGINGPDGAKREVFLIDYYDNQHDIFIANVGDEPLTGLNVTLEDAQNIKLDPYWTVGGEGNDQLAAFDSVQKNTYYGELSNVAKIRLIPDGEGEISGTLTISAEDQEPVVITLTGNAGDPRLTTTDIPQAVKYVPYAVQILHNNMYSWNTVTLDVIWGSLPQGVELKPNGELYGVPKEAGIFEFEIELTNSDTRFGTSTEYYILEVLENTNENVDDATDVGYEVTKRIGTPIGDDDVITKIADHEFVTDGQIDEFISFWLNGEKMTEGTDYDKEPGSTKITIRSQTFQNKVDRSATNTISAEFRVEGDENNELKRAAQNFKMDISSGRGGGSGSSGTTQPTNPITPDPKPEGTPEPQTVITSPEPITETIQVPATVVGQDAQAEPSTEAVTNALANAVNKGKETPEKEPIVITLVVTGLTSDVSDINVAIPDEVIQALSDGENVSLKVDAGSLGILTLSNEGLRSLLDHKGQNIQINISHDAGDVAVNVIANGTSLEKIDGGIKIMLIDMAEGEVIVLVRTDGGEEIVKKSVVENGTILALLDGSGTIRVIYNAKRFVDVNSTDWFYNAILFVSSRELFVGINDETFAPNLPMTRAMIATVLYRLEAEEGIGAGAGFTDVLPGQWYSQSIAWATSTALLSGYGDGVFGPNDNITREQLAVLMYRYAEYIGMSTIDRGDTQRFSDVGQISPWAEDALRWAVGVGLMQGDGSSLNPQGQASRAQVAEMTMRLVSLLVK